MQRRQRNHTFKGKQKTTNGTYATSFVANGLAIQSPTQIEGTLRFFIAVCLPSPALIKLNYVLVNYSLNYPKLKSNLSLEVQRLSAIAYAFNTALYQHGQNSLRSLEEIFQLKPQITHQVLNCAPRTCLLHSR